MSPSLPRLFYGTCHGGPCQGSTLAHGAGTYRLAYDRRFPNKCFPGMQTSQDPEVAFGLYVFDQPAKIWRWEEK